MKTRLSKDVELIIVHDYGITPEDCRPGEEIIAIIVVYRGRRYRLPLGPTHMLVVDLLARRGPRDAWRIAEQMQDDPFVTYHATNAPSGSVRPARTSRSGAKQQMHRIIKTIEAVIAEEKIDIAATTIIRCDTTSSGTVEYSIGCPVHWEHPPQEGRNWISDFDIPEVGPRLIDHAHGVRLSM